MHLTGSSFVAGDKGENLFSNNESSVPNEGTNDGNDEVGHYTGSRTLMAWVRLQNDTWLGGDRAIISLGKDNYGHSDHCDSQDPSDPEAGADPHCTGFALHVSGDGQFVVGNTRGGNQTSSIGPGITCTTNTYDLNYGDNHEDWFFVVATYNSEDAEDSDNSDTVAGNSTKIYVNGNLCARGNIYRPYTEVSANSRWAIGGSINTEGNISPTYQNYFKGFVDDVRVFDRALPESEIDALYVSNNNGG